MLKDVQTLQSERPNQPAYAQKRNQDRSSADYGELGDPSAPPALPRPPACTCALTTQTSPPSALAALTASSAVEATRPLGTGTPYAEKSSFDWYS